MLFLQAYNRPLKKLHDRLTALIEEINVIIPKKIFFVKFRRNPCGLTGNVA